MLIVTGAAKSGLAMPNSAAQRAPARSSVRRAPPAFDLTVFITPPLENRFWIGYDVGLQPGMRGASATRFANRCLVLDALWRRQYRPPAVPRTRESCRFLSLRRSFEASLEFVHHTRD